jgi:protein TonB
LKTAITLFLFSVSIAHGYCQNTSDSASVPTRYIVIDEMARFPDGEAGIQQFIKDNLKYPANEKRKQDIGTCYITFVVERDGSIGDARIFKEIPNEPEYNQAALAVVKQMPRWIPGKQNGVPVSVQFNLPIRFSTLKRSRKN